MGKGLKQNVNPKQHNIVYKISVFKTVKLVCIDLFFSSLITAILIVLFLIAEFQKLPNRWIEDLAKIVK